MPAFDCARVLQAWMRSDRIRPNLELLPLAQFLNQEPPRSQQLFLPDLLMVPHLGHAEVLDVVGAAAGVYMQVLVQD